MNYREEAYLMHYGVPGMKWGKRAAKAVGSYVGQSFKLAGNQLFHPLRSSVAKAEMYKRSSVGAKFRQTQGLLSTKEMKRMNDSIAKQKGKKISGKKFVDSMITNVGTELVAAVAVGAAARVGSAIVRSTLG